jgi:hypothetical protein
MSRFRLTALTNPVEELAAYFEPVGDAGTRLFTRNTLGKSLFDNCNHYLGGLLRNSDRSGEAHTMDAARSK